MNKKRKGKAKGGRPCLLTTEVEKGILIGVSAGLRPVAAARAIGIQNATFWTWIRHAKTAKRRSRFFKFFNKIQTTQAQAVRRLIFIISKAAEEDANHAKWMLSKLQPKIYGSSREADAFKKENEMLRARIAELGRSPSGDSRPRVQIVLHPDIRADADANGVADLDILIDDDELEQMKRERVDL